MGLNYNLYIKTKYFLNIITFFFKYTNNSIGSGSKLAYILQSLSIHFSANVRDYTKINRAPANSLDNETPISPKFSWAHSLRFVRVSPFDLRKCTRTYIYNTYYVYRNIYLHIRACRMCQNSHQIIEPASYLR